MQLHRLSPHWKQLKKQRGHKALSSLQIPTTSGVGHYDRPILKMKNGNLQFPVCLSGLSLLSALAPYSADSRGRHITRVQGNGISPASFHFVLWVDAEST